MQIQSLGAAANISSAQQKNSESVVSDLPSVKVLGVAGKEQDSAEVQPAEMDEAVRRINETVQSLNKNVGLEFSTDKDTKIRMVKLIDQQSKEVLRQLPNEEVIAIAKALDKLQGLLVREKA
ncbi:flagellar protein FlaG [Chitinibacter sp. S2-10]|uniref:flagellar protein FlaG n=1 Tax=Chitinibacter sp. S2-10 TaxID=3373597 RepID=UPI003977A5EA